MLHPSRPSFLLASHDAALLTALEPLLLAIAAQVEIVLSLEAALDSLAAPEPPTLLLLDADLPGLDPRMNIERLLVAIGGDKLSRPSIVLIADSVTPEGAARLAAGLIDDLVLRAAGAPYFCLRARMLLRHRQESLEMETLRETQRRREHTDRLTGVFNRETILTMLFRETDRVQRLNSPLSLLLLDIDDFGQWNARLGNDACDDLLRQVAARLARLLRSYDLLGRPGKDEFLIALPGSSPDQAILLAERIRAESFSALFRAAGQPVRLSASFGIASSQGRSPVVVLREAEQALHWARIAGPDSIQCYGDPSQAALDPARFLS